MLRVLLVLMCACRADLTDWAIREADTEKPLDDGSRLGVGLVTHAALALQSHESQYYYAPGGVEYVADRPDAVLVTVIGEIELSGLGWHATRVDIQPTTAGENRIRFISHDTDESYSFAYSAVEPTAGEFLVTDPIEGPNLSVTMTGSDFALFTGTQVKLWTDYTAAGMPIFGRRPVALTADAASGTKLDFATLSLGSSPHSFTMTTDLLVAPASVRVLGQSAIAGIQMLDAGNEHPLQSLVLKQGLNSFLRPYPTDATGLLILGHPRSSFTYTVSGSAVSVRLAPDGEVLTVHGDAIGQGTITITWGTASLAFAIEVVAP